MVAWSPMRGAPEGAADRGALAGGWLVLFGLLTAALFSGDSFWVGAAALLTATVVLALHFLGRLPLSSGGVPLVAALVGLATWSGISIAWSVAPDRSWEELNQGLVYAAFAVLGVAAGSTGPRALRLVALVLAGSLGAAVLWALAGKAIPALFPDGGRAARLRDPIGYWNALALAANALLVLGLWLAARPIARPARLVGIVLAYAAVVATLLAVSRTGLLGAIVAVALWLVLSGDRVERALLALAATVPAVAVAAWAFTRPGLVEDGQAHADRVAAGAWFGVLVLAGGAVAALAAAWLGSRSLTPKERRRTGRALALGAVAAVAMAGAAVVLVADPAEGGASVQSPGRLGDASLNNRWTWWGEAWELFVAAPLQGSGAGSFEVAHRRLQEAFVPAVEPHDVPLQFLAGTGILGFVLFAAVVGATAVAAVGALSPNGGRGACGGSGAHRRQLRLSPPCARRLQLGLPRGDGAGARRSRRACRRLAAAPGSSQAAVRGCRRRGRRLRVPRVARLALARGAHVRQVNRELDAGNTEAAAAAARRARSLNPLSIEPSLRLAGVETRRGRVRAAREAYAQAIRTQPENSDTWFALGSYEFALEDLCNAYVHLNEAYTLDPSSRRWTPGGPLDLARAHVNAGRC